MASRSIDVVLSWSRAQAGTTVVLKQLDGGGWDEVDRTDTTELTVRGLNAESAYVFAATAGVTVAHELRVGDSWEDGQLVASGVTGTTYSWAWSASGAQTFHVKSIDRLGRASREAASAAVAIALLDDHVTSDESDQGTGG